jgi:hypothetical protein
MPFASSVISLRGAVTTVGAAAEARPARPEVDA